MGRLLLLLALVTGCVPHPVSATPAPRDWDFSARPTAGEIRVLPLAISLAPVPLERAGSLGVPVSWHRLALRWRRTLQVDRVPEEALLALPGAVHREVGPAWPATFRLGRWPANGRGRLLAALDGRADLEATLSELARDVGGDASLFVWVEEVDGGPLSAHALPGELVRTPAGPVVVDSRDEAYRVTAMLGLALVARDGEIVVRYRDAFDTVLTGERDAGWAGRELALALAREVALVWPTLPR